MVSADNPFMRTTSSRCERNEASSIDKSSKNGSKTAGMTPEGMKDIENFFLS
jgi:hypothetical protein